MIIVMNRFQVNPGQEARFEESFSGRAGLVEGCPGFLGLDVLRPDGQGEYVAMARWENREAWINWRESEAFRKAHEKRHPGMLAGHPRLEAYEVFEHCASPARESDAGAKG